MLLVKNLGKQITKSVVREGAGNAEHLFTHHAKTLRLRDQDPAKERPPNPHFIVSVAQVPDVSRLRSLTDLCGLLVTVEST
jgi:hypothetical protein